MTLQAALRRRLDNPALSPDERARLRCDLAKRLEESGDYEGAREAMGTLWQRVGERPDVNGLNLETAAEVLLRAGTLSGWIASTRQLEAGQDPAKDLLTECIRAFASLRHTIKFSEGAIELAYCYWREGNFDEAHVWLDEADRGLGDDSSDLRALSVLRRSIVYFGQGKFRKAASLLEQSAPLFEATGNHSLKGRFHSSLGSYLKRIGEVEASEEFTDRALVEYAAAGYHYEQSRHHAYQAVVENQLGFIFTQKGNFEEAHRHLNRARRLFVQIKDKVHTAQVDETRARTFLAEKNPAEAERSARQAVTALEKGGHQALLAEALVTLGTAQARLNKISQAKLSLNRASDISEHAGDYESAGRAAIIMLEELLGTLNPQETETIYERADQHLAQSNNPESLKRLRACARRIIINKRRNMQTPQSVHQKEEEEVKPQDLIKDRERLTTDPQLKVKWEGFSLKGTLLEFEEALIERALSDAGGNVSKAADLLGLSNHSSLINKLNTKHKGLLSARTPPRPRNRSLNLRDEKKSGH